MSQIILVRIVRFLEIILILPKALSAPVISRISGAPLDGLRDPESEYRTAGEFADYALLDCLGPPLAIVEAKRKRIIWLIRSVTLSAQCNWPAS